MERYAARGVDWVHLSVLSSDGTPLTALQACLRTSDILPYGTIRRRLLASFLLARVQLRSRARSEPPRGPMYRCVAHGGHHTWAPGATSAAQQRIASNKSPNLQAARMA